MDGQIATNEMEKTGDACVFIAAKQSNIMISGMLAQPKIL
jgi:hypothetical protein